MPRGVPYDYLNLTDPNADVLAADASVRAHGVCEEGAIALVQAFWGAVRSDAALGGHPIREWLTSDAFAEWAAICGAKPEDAREAILNQ